MQMTKKECLDRIEHLEKTVEIQADAIKRLKDMTDQLIEGLVKWNRWYGSMTPK